MARPEVTDDARITQPEAARLLGDVSAMTMWRWRNNPEMQFPEAIQVNGRIYFRRAEIVSWQPPAKAPSPDRAERLRRRSA
jgi:hypothetical protein